MGRDTPPPSVTSQLWAVAAGRCEFEGCNKILWKDYLTKKRGNKGAVAHIVAYQPDGPRGDAVRSPRLRKDISNLMLMCPEHHKEIDDHPEIYPEKMLLKMKEKHEARIEMQTSIKPDMQSHVVYYAANIGNQAFRLNPQVLNDAIYPYYPVCDHVIELGNINSAHYDNQAQFWGIEREQLKRKFDTLISSRIALGEITHLSVFAIAPQPLLIDLGRLLSDIVSVEIYQKHRDPDNWKWLDDQNDVMYSVIEPEYIYDTVALNLSLSGNIDNSRITSVLGEKTSIWTITIDNPYNDFLRSRNHLADFRKELRFLYNKIKIKHGQNTELHVFPACPVSAAIEIGRVRMPKADLPLFLYDQNRDTGGFVKAFNI